MNLDSGLYGYSPYPRYDYRYEAFRPSYPSNVPRPSLPDRTFESDPPLYRPGNDGGIPDLTDPLAPQTPLEMLPRADRDVSRTELRRAAKSLRNALFLRGEQGEVWLRFLEPDMVLAAIDQGEVPENLAELAARYDGVTMNPDLESLSRLSGFEATRQGLRRWVEEAVPTSPSTSNAPPTSVESSRAEQQDRGEEAGESDAGGAETNTRRSKSPDREGDLLDPPPTPPIPRNVRDPQPADPPKLPEQESFEELPVPKPSDL